MYRLAAIACLVVACGPKTLDSNPPLAETSSEPWVKEHRELVVAGCECESSACLEEAKAKIAALEAEHGGLDESPADVHNAHGEFEQCYQSGTRDPQRDLNAVTRRMCGCADAGCVKQTMIARLKFEDKYGAVSADSELGKLDAEYNRCKDDRIIDGDKLAAHYERIMATTCACAAGKGCGVTLTDLPPMPAAVVINNLDAHQHRIDTATERICNCAKNAGLLGTYGGFVVTKRCTFEKE